MELFKILGTIAIENGKANQAIGETGDHASKMASTLGTAFNKAGKFAVAAGKTIAKGLLVGSVAMGKLIQSAVESYAEYEQLVGGVETLFGTGGKTLEEYAASVGKTVEAATKEYKKLAKAEKTVFENAKKAYKTAGLSANEYMETVTSFSASLISSLGGDTEAAAEIADMAIRDMSDNANKMGTDMAAIQNAYMGFAKQNYTMLDNLKLGYGGTQSEMKRLLKEAEKLTGVKYDINNLADVYAAIHAIQEEMGITGTTAAEAEKTISGSFNSMKSAWENMMSGIAGAGDLDTLIANFVESASNFVGNITALLPSIVQGVNGLIQGITPYIPDMLKGILPSLLDGAASLFIGLASSLPQLIGVIIDELPNIVNKFTEAFEPILGETLTGILQGIGTTFVNIIGSIHSLITGEVNGLGGTLKSEAVEWKESLEDTKREYEDILATEEERKKIAEGYLDTLTELEGKEIKTDEELTAMKDAVDGLVALYPDFKKYVDEETGLFTENASAIRDNVAALHELAVAKARQSYKEKFEEHMTQGIDNYLQASASRTASLSEAEKYKTQLEGINAVMTELEQVGADGNLSRASSNIIAGNEALKELFNFSLDGLASVEDVWAYRDAMAEMVGITEELNSEYGYWLTSAQSDENTMGFYMANILAEGEEYLGLLREIDTAKGGMDEASAKFYAQEAASIAQFGELSQEAKEAWAAALIVLGTPPDEAETIAGLKEVAEEAGETKKAADATAEAVKNMFPDRISTSGVENAAGIVNTVLAGVIAQAAAAAAAISAAFTIGVTNGNLHVTPNVPGHKTGLDFVPRDNYLARLHQGEAVLTAEEAREWRNGQNGRQEVYHGESIITGNNFYIQQESDIYDLAVELSSLRRESRRGKGART